jgi:PII-like signaling protein
MEHTNAAQQVWIFVKENDQWRHQSLFLAILEFLRREGVAGATAIRGIAGFGARGHVHTATLVELGSELPIVILFVDRADRVDRIMPQLTFLCLAICGYSGYNGVRQDWKMQSLLANLTEAAPPKLTANGFLRSGARRAYHP